jgi:hypothetical protein
VVSRQLQRCGSKAPPRPPRGRMGPISDRPSKRAYHAHENASVERYYGSRAACSLTVLSPKPCTDQAVLISMPPAAAHKQTSREVQVAP